MLNLRMWQMNAFTDRIFAGNRAAVLILEGDWLPEAMMQAVATENNLANSAFAKPQMGGSWNLRWSTPVHEAAFCSHVTLNTAYVLAAELDIEGEFLFSAGVGELRVGRKGDLYRLDIPASCPSRWNDPPPALAEVFSDGWRATFRNFENLFIEFKDKAAVRAFAPDLACAATLHPLGLCVTACGAGQHDFVSRYVAPGAGIPKDPVTSSTHVTLVPQ